MHRIAQIRISQLNEQIICGLCFGYLIDAATIVECLHSFCRSCLVQHVADSNTCPLCCQLIHKTKPLVNIRSDKTLQNLVYKLVPGLFKSEMERRRNFYSQHPEAVPDVGSPNAREERGDIHEDPWLMPNNKTELISILFQYSAIFPKTHPKVPEPNDRRYLLCPSYITVAVLKKFVRCKFNLPTHFHIELYYSDECLDDSYSVMDISFLYSWRRVEPLRLFYFILDPSLPAVWTLGQKSFMSATHDNNNISISAEKVVQENLECATGLEDIHRTPSVEGMHPLRLRRLSTKRKPEQMHVKGLSNSRQIGEPHGGAISSSSRSVHVLNTSHDLWDAADTCRSSSCHQQTLASSAPSSTEHRSIWSVLPSPNSHIQEGKSSATINGRVTAGGGSPGSASSRRTSVSGYHRPDRQSHGSFSIYEDPHPSSRINPSTSANLPMSTNISMSTKQSASTIVTTSTIQSTPTAKVGIVISRGRAMPLQDKHLHMAPIIPTSLPPLPPLAHSSSLATSSSSVGRKLTSIRRLLELRAESENLMATRKRKLSDQEDGLPPISSALDVLAQTPTTRQKVARVFRDRNAVYTSSYSPSSKLLATISPPSPLLSLIQAQSIYRHLKPPRQVVNHARPVERTRSGDCISISCADEPDAATIANGLVLNSSRSWINQEHQPSGTNDD